MPSTITKEYLKTKQYKKSNYLEARIVIHKRFSTNKESFYKFISHKIDLPNFSNILDVGCGTGHFWIENFSLLKKDARLLLTDFSEGMIEKVKKNISHENIRVEVADIEKLPFPDNSFDLVMAHHVVYHANDKDKALRELQRVVIPNGGKITITTNSVKHMLNVYEIGASIDKNYPTDRIIDSFTEEIADEMLGQYFKNVEKYVQEDMLKVTDISIMINYVKSSLEPRNIKVCDDFYEKYTDIIKNSINEKGYFPIPKRSPLYICYNESI